MLPSPHYEPLLPPILPPTPRDFLARETQNPNCKASPGQTTKQAQRDIPRGTLTPLSLPRAQETGPTQGPCQGPYIGAPFLGITLCPTASLFPLSLERLTCLISQALMLVF